VSGCNEGGDCNGCDGKNDCDDCPTPYPLRTSCIFCTDCEGGSRCQGHMGGEGFGHAANVRACTLSIGRPGISSAHFLVYKYSVQLFTKAWGDLKKVTPFFGKIDVTLTIVIVYKWGDFFESHPLFHPLLKKSVAKCNTRTF